MGVFTKIAGWFTAAKAIVGLVVPKQANIDQSLQSVLDAQKNFEAAKATYQSLIAAQKAAQDKVNGLS